MIRVHRNWLMRVVPRKLYRSTHAMFEKIPRVVMAEHWPNMAGKSLSKSIYKWETLQQAMFDSRRVCRQDNVESHYFQQHLLFLLQHWTLHQFSTDFANFIPFEPRTPKFPVPEMVETVRKSSKNTSFPVGKITVEPVRPARDVWAPLQPCGHELLVQHWPVGDGVMGQLLTSKRWVENRKNMVVLLTFEWWLCQ